MITIVFSRKSFDEVVQEYITPVMIELMLAPKGTVVYKEATVGSALFVVLNKVKDASEKLADSLGIPEVVIRPLVQASRITLEEDDDTYYITYAPDLESIEIMAGEEATPGHAARVLSMGANLALKKREGFSLKSTEYKGEHGVAMEYSPTPHYMDGVTNPSTEEVVQ